MRAIRERAQVIALMRLYARGAGDRSCPRAAGVVGVARRALAAVAALKASGVLSCLVVSDVVQTGYRPDKNAPLPLTS
jgi:hypothetical protein